MLKKFTKYLYEDSTSTFCQYEIYKIPSQLKFRIKKNIIVKIYFFVLNNIYKLLTK